MQAKRIEAFRAQNQQEYVKKFREAHAAHKLVMVEFTKKAAEHVGVTKEVWQKSQETYMKQKDKAEELKK